MNRPLLQSGMCQCHVLRQIPAALVLAVCCIAAPRLTAQSAARVAADAPSRNAETRVQHDSLTAHFRRTPRGKPAALSAGGKTAAQARKFDGRPEPVPRPAPVVTPLPERAKSVKP